MNIEIQVENIKCGGCASTIKKKLMEDSQVKDVDVNIEQGIVSLDILDDVKNQAAQIQDIRSGFVATLLKAGYPESGTAEGIAAARAKAKSFVSCAVGKVENMVNKE